MPNIKQKILKKNIYFIWYLFTF